MRVSSLLYIGAIAMLIGCGADAEEDRSKDAPVEFATPIPKGPGHADLTTYKTMSDRRFVVIEKTNSQGKRRITVQGANFPESEEIYTLNDTDPIEKGLMADLDKDGYEELYLITRSTNARAEATIYGFASLQDNNYTKVYVPKLDSSDPRFRGTKGHSNITIQGDRLMRQIPIYAQGDHITRPTGGQYIVGYALERPDSQLELVPKEISTHK